MMREAKDEIDCTCLLLGPEVSKGCVVSSYT
jgi:hypothetical protein